MSVGLGLKSFINKLKINLSLNESSTSIAVIFIIIKSTLMEIKGIDVILICDFQSTAPN